MEHAGKEHINVGVERLPAVERASVDAVTVGRHAPAVPTLEQLRIGGIGVVEDVTGNDAMSIRLLEMGLVPGTPVKLLKQAPMGDPLQLQLRGYHLSLRRAEAARVRLRGASTR